MPPGTTAAYVHHGYPAVPDLEVALELRRHAERLAVGADFAVLSGLNVSSDAFYAETPEVVAEFSRLGMLNVEMESSAMYVVARLRGLRAGMICACSSNLVDGSSVYDAGQRLHDGWTASIQAALDTAVALDL